MDQSSLPAVDWVEILMAALVRVVARVEMRAKLQAVVVPLARLSRLPTSVVHQAEVVVQLRVARVAQVDPSDPMLVHPAALQQVRRQEVVEVHQPFGVKVA